MCRRHIIFLVICIGWVEPRNAPVTCSWDVCNAGKSDMLNVHLVSHSHDDAGWLKTVDQYYTGSNQSITGGAVQYTYDTVVATLQENPERRFTFCETSFFWRWWNQQHDFVRHQFKNMIFNGQLEVVGGGWVQNDEATTHYTAIIDQIRMTVGLRLLNETFGQCGKPKVAWQIDPFGHSREQAALFSEMGFDGLFFGRLHYMDKEKRMKNKAMEMVWQGSDDPKRRSELFTGVNFNGYGPPPGLCFDEYCGDDPIQDDHKLDGYNVDKKLALFYNFTQAQAKAYGTNHIMLTMGSDFQYTNAQMWYKNLDKLIRLVNEQQANGKKVNVFYSTPSCYMKAVHAAAPKLPTKSDDFFPYASGPDSYWTGYFTSRPAVKGFVRQANNALKVCKQMDAAALLGPSDYGDLDVLMQAMALLQHHDAVAGTERQHVANDYMKRLYSGMVECEQVVNDALLRLLPKQEGTPPPRQSFCLQTNISLCHISQTKSDYTVTVFNGQAHGVSRYVRVPTNSRSVTVTGPDSSTVPAQVVPSFLPTSQLGYVQSPAAYDLVFPVSVPPMGFATYFVSKQQHHHHHRASSTTFHSRIETADLTKCKSLEVVARHQSRHKRDGGGAIKSRYAYDRRTNSCVNLLIPASHWNRLTTSPLSALKGVNLFAHKSTCVRHCVSVAYQPDPAHEQTAAITSLANDNIQLDFDASTGLLHAVKDLQSGLSQQITQNFYYYEGAVNNKQGKQASGAYVFRPNSSSLAVNSEIVSLQQITGPLVNEMRQIFSPWLSQTVRIYKDKPFVEFEWTVGPIPFRDNISREIISRFDSQIASNAMFYTDANGRPMMPRRRDHQATFQYNDTEKITRNYYPVNSRIAISDSTVQMTVLTDRTQGGSSLTDGSIELMVHRRDLQDDHFGVGEPLNETGVDGRGLVVRGRHWLLLSPPATAALQHRTVAMDIFHQPILAFSPLKTTVPLYKKDYVTTYGSLTHDLPVQVNLLTIEQWQARSKLLRLEHIMQKGETGAKSVNVTINDLFSSFDILSVEELTLGANKLIDEQQVKLSWTKQGFISQFGDFLLNRFKTPETGIYKTAGGQITVSLDPMQIRTFKCAVRPKF